MLLQTLWVGCLLAGKAIAQSDSSSSAIASASSTSSSTRSRGQTSSIESDTRSFVTLTGTVESTPTGTYQTATNQVTRPGSTGLVNGGSSTGSSNATAATTSSPGTTSLVTLLLGGGVGEQTLSVINGTTTIFPNTTASATRTSTAAQATNTQACNNYPEFCNRKYSNITEVCAHNSAFARTGNAASNQMYGIEQQLNDGIRMIQGETHYVNDTIYNCHTNCDILNTGTYQSELQTVREWIETHPYDVVTLLIVNSDYIGVGNYTTPIQNSGLGSYVYTPPYVPMRKNQWPTLSELILSGKRVVVFMDYQANQTEVPYILDEFSHMWETPFSPQNRSFPCDVQRPPTLTNMTEARDNYMYLANHNLNQDVSLFGSSLLIPNTAELNVTNAAGTDRGMLGAMAETCVAEWNAAPNFLLVDYYNVGDGSVFEVAAKWNNVTYNRPCCGTTTSAAPQTAFPAAASMLVTVLTIMLLL